MTKAASIHKAEQRFYLIVFSISLACLISIGLLIGRIIFSDSLRYVFLIWNLVLAIVPLILAWWLSIRIKEQGWLKWQQIILSFAWLAFLPNSFYLITDFVHIRATSESSLYLDVVMIASFVLNGLILGLFSVYLIHNALKRRLSEGKALLVVALIFILCSFAIYLGRFTRWNSWDILLRPAGLLFDVSDRFLNPSQHTDTYVATITLSAVLFSVYLVLYSAARMITHDKQPKSKVN